MLHTDDRTRTGNTKTKENACPMDPSADRLIRTAVFVKTSLWPPGKAGGRKGEFVVPLLNRRPEVTGGNSHGNLDEGNA